MNRTGLILGFFTGIILCPHASNAQYTTDFQTITISGVASNGTGDYLIGSNTFADVLLIQDTGALSIGFGLNVALGYETSSSNNTVLVTGTGSIWDCGWFSSISVGYSGMNNSLTISSGGRVIDGLDACVGIQCR
ncbi:MAG TPA: hypothetical protein VL171_06825 [Verrucomicrobiae bacterium]|nr:hypothetical protein [Verrucomicrobiae bacterium]